MSSIYGSAAGANVIYGKNNTGVAFTSATAGFDDSKLMAYWKFNESSGNIGNSSQSSDSLGSDGDLIMTGGTYEQSAPLGSTNALLFDGTDDFGVVSSGSNTLSQFNFIQEGQSTICFWMKLVSSYNYSFMFINNDWSSQAGTLLFMTKNASCGTTCGTLQQPINNGAPLDPDSQIVDMAVGGSNFGYVPDITDYYFYTIRVDVDLTTDTGIWHRNNGAESKHDRINAPDTGVNSPSPFTIARRSNASQYFANIELSEMSIWNRILTADETIELYNSGNGKAIYE